MNISHALRIYALSQTTFVSLNNLGMEFVKIITMDLFVTWIWVTVVSICQLVVALVPVKS